MMHNFRGRGLITRRSLVTGSAALAGAAALGFPSAHADDKVVSLLSWPGHGAQDVVGDFEKALALREEMARDAAAYEAFRRELVRDHPWLKPVVGSGRKMARRVIVLTRNLRHPQVEANRQWLESLNVS